MNLTEAEIFRFNNYVDRSGECWLWTGMRNENGYGYFWIRGKQIGAHRLSYCIANDIPFSSDVYVMHKCDNPPCVKPGHLVRSTHKENMMDAGAKGKMGTSQPGSNNPAAKLTEKDIPEIRRLHEMGIGSSDISRNYGVSPDAIDLVVKRKTWRHVA